MKVGISIIVKPEESLFKNGIIQNCLYAYDVIKNISFVDRVTLLQISLPDQVDLDSISFLKEYDKDIDYIYLDAFDYDHGRHSKIRKELNIPDKYIFLHYRYERDFIKFFQVKIPNLNKIIKEINSNNKPIYIASTNINQLLDKKEDYIYYKNEEKLKTLNFEEKAMIDFLFGLDSYEIQGHKKSSFSNVLNNIKGTNNYYS